MHLLKIQKDSCCEHFMVCNFFFFAFLMAQQYGICLQIQEIRVRSLGREDPLEEGLASHSSIAAWRISWTEMPGRIQSMGSKRVVYDLMSKKQWQKILFYPKGKKIINKYWILVNNLHMETLRRKCAQPISPALLPLAPPTTADSWASPAPASKQITRTAS